MASRFLVHVQRIGGRQLHARGKFVAGNPRIQFRLVRTLLAMRLIQLAQQIALRLHQRRRHFRARLQIQYRRAFGAKSRALINRRQPRRLPVRNAIDRQALRVVEHHVGRQVLILRAQAVGHPRAHRRPAGDRAAGVHQEQRRLVIGMLAIHGADQRDVVGAPCRWRQHVGDFHAALPCPLELEGRRETACPPPCRSRWRSSTRGWARCRPAASKPAWGRTDPSGWDRRS